MTRASWAIAFVTLERPVAAQRFVRSARRRFPDVPIYVADQSRALGRMAAFYDAERVVVVPMAFDAGLSRSRNALVEAMDADYIALCDDDFVLGPDTSFESAIDVLEEDESLGVVGGLLHEYDGVTESIRNWEMFFDHDERHRRFTAIPIYNYPARSRQIAGHTIYACDAVLNFAVLRKAIFSRGLRWDDTIKINGEHEDFYLSLMKQSPYRVAYLPTLAALHHHLPQQGAYAQMRARHDGRHVFMRKWGLDSHVEIGSGVRPLDGTPVHEWFARASDETGRIRHDADRDRSAAAPAGVSSMLLYTPAHDDAALPSEPQVHQTGSFLQWLGAGQLSRQPIAAGGLLIAYRPDVDPEGDLLLWARIVSASHEPSSPDDEAGVVLRWLAPGGDMLVWESDIYTIGRSESRYWVPISSPMPVWPRDAKYLRFDVVSASAERAPLATGFVFSAPSTRPESSPGASPEVLAMSRTSAEAAGVDVAPEPLDALLAGAPRHDIDVVHQAGRAWVTADLSRVDLFGLASRRPGRPAEVVVAAGTGRVQTAPVGIALPNELVSDPSIVLFGGRGGNGEGGLVVLVPRLTDASAADVGPGAHKHAVNDLGD